MPDSAPTGRQPRTTPSEVLPYAAQRHPDKVALVVGDTRLTYRELNALSSRVAAALISRGIRPGDVVSLYGQNSWQWIVSYHGVLKAGGVVNPVNVMLTGPELTYVLNDCNAKAVLAGEHQAATVAAILEDLASVQMAYTFGPPDPDLLRSGVTTWDDLLSGIDADVGITELAPAPRDLCSIGYTSGTTGHPKGAMQSHQAVLLNCALTATMHGRSENDVIVTALPAAHVYGNVAINGTFLAGGSVVLMERFDAARAIRLIEENRATMFEGVPAMYSMLLSEPAFGTADLTSLRKSTIGGQTFSSSITERWQNKVAGPLLELWGMTEVAGLGTTHALHAPPVPGSIGVALPGIEVKIAPMDGTSAEVPAGTPGELVVRGPLVMLGYHNQARATEEVLGTDGWMRTGDIAYADDSGHFFVVDRLKDMILTAGYNVYPAEIERVICEHEDVAMAAVGRGHDDVKGEVAIAYVVAAPGRTLPASTLMDHCRTNLAAYKCPREIVFVDALPMTSSGKIMRRKLTDTKR